MSFPLRVDPLALDACIEVDHALLAELIKRLMYPKSTSDDAAGLLSADRGLLEFLLLAVMARANSDLRMPVRLGLGRAYAGPDIDDSANGVAVECGDAGANRARAILQGMRIALRELTAQAAGAR